MHMLMSAKASQTMSSREIADLCQKEHKNVTVVIESLIEAQILTAEIQRSTFEHRGNSYKCFLLNKRDSLVVVARLSPEFTAAVVDRWQELEAKQPLREPNRIELAQWVIEAETKLAKVTEQLSIAAPKVHYYDAVVDRTNLLNTTQIAQKLRMSAIHLNTILDGLAVYNKSVKRSRVFQQWFLDKGYGLIRQTEQGYSQPMFTLKGEAWIIQKLVSEGVTAI